MADRLTASFNPAGGSRAAQISLWDLTLDRFAVLLLNPLSITFALLGIKLCGGFSLWSCKPEKLWSQTWPYIAFLFFTDHIDSHSCRVSIFAGDGDSHQVGYCPGVATLRDLPAKWRHGMGWNAGGLGPKIVNLPRWRQSLMAIFPWREWLFCHDFLKIGMVLGVFLMFLDKAKWFVSLEFCLVVAGQECFVLFSSWCFMMFHHDVSWALW